MASKTTMVTGSGKNSGRMESLLTRQEAVILQGILQAHAATLGLDRVACPVITQPRDGDWRRGADECCWEVWVNRSPSKRVTAALFARADAAVHAILEAARRGALPAVPGLRA